MYTTEAAVRVIVEAFGKAWMLTSESVKLAEPCEAPSQFDAEVPEPEEKPDADEKPEPGSKYAQSDPHGTISCMTEQSGQGALEVQRFSGAGVYPVPDGKRRFGFHGFQV